MAEGSGKIVDKIGLNLVELKIYLAWIFDTPRECLPAVQLVLDKLSESLYQRQGGVSCCILDLLNIHIRLLILGTGVNSNPGRPGPSSNMIASTIGLAPVQRSPP